MMQPVRVRYFNRVYRYRLHIALAASLCAHWAVGTTFEYRASAHVPAVGTAPFEVWIHSALLGETVLPETVIRIPEITTLASTTPAPVPKRERGIATVRQNAQAATDEAVEHSTRPVPPVPSSEYYSAQELDIYPRLRMPLKLELGDLSIERPLIVFLSLSEAGIVEAVEMKGEAPRMAEARVRDALRESRFSPAVKDGRPVKSRITLNIGSRLDAARPAE
jgi:hypothetical protein